MANCIPKEATTEGPQGTEITDPGYWMLGFDVSPDVSLNGVGINTAKEEAVRIGLFSRFRLPSAVMSRLQETANLMRAAFESRRTYLLRIGPEMMDTFAKSMKRYGITEANFDRVALATGEIKRVAKEGVVGAYEFTGKHASILAPDEKKFVEATRISLDRLWRIVRGYDTKVVPILEELGLKNDPATMKVLQSLQEGLQPDSPLPVEYYLAAERTQGLINIKPDHDLSGELDPNKWFGLMPIDQERTALLSEIKDLQDQVSLDPHQPDIEARQVDLMWKLQRLSDLETQIEKKSQRTILGQVLPGKQHYAPLTLAKDPDAAAFLFESNPKNIMRRAVWGALTKRYFDELLHNAKIAKPRIGDVDLENYMVDWINIQRGVTGYHADAWIRQVATQMSEKLGKGAVTEDMVRNAVSDMMKFQVMTKLFMGMRFPVVNSLQSVMTVYPLVGAKTYAKAVMRAFTKEAWIDAKAYGILGEAGERFMLESAALSPDRWIDNLMNKWPLTKLAERTEQWNRVVANEAGKIDYEVTGRVHPALRTVNQSVRNLTPKAAARAVGKGMVDSTQFILSKENRPLAFSGSSARRLFFQFRTFGVAYSTLAVDLWKHDKVGFARMAGALGFIGGLPAFPMFDFVRHQILKNTGFALPENNGFSLLGNAITFGFLPQVPFDVTSTIEPFNLPRSLQGRDLISSALGPTFGPFVNFVGDLSNTGLSPEAGKAAVRMLSPTAVNIGESIVEDMRGGTHTPAGELMVERTAPQRYMHMAGLFPSAKSDYYGIRQKLVDAIQSGNMDTVAAIRQESEARGVRVTDKMLRGIRAQIKGAETKTRWKDILDMFAR